MQSGNISKILKEKSRKRAWPRSRDPINFGVHPNVSPKRVELQSSNLVHRCIVAISQKPAEKNLGKGRGLGRVTPQNFGVHPNVSPKRVELETWNLAHRRTVAISPKSAKKNIEKVRGLCHVTPIIFGVHPNVSPKRGLGHVTPKILAYTLTSRDRDLKFGTQVHSGNISKTRKEKSRKGRGLGHVTP